ncbi:hypothetical protein [Microcoleus sp. herbarium12]|uniref:hypothetical protein n=1 Tax=Microcoleus sp. herbarium12 TaxID=3055437 RepID=UPI002FD01F93
MIFYILAQVRSTLSVSQARAAGKLSLFVNRTSNPVPRGHRRAMPARAIIREIDCRSTQSLAG